MADLSEDFELKIDDQIELSQNLVEHMSREELEKHTKDFIYFQLQAEHLMKTLSHQDRFCIDEYLNNPVRDINRHNSTSFIQEIQYFTELAKRFANIVKLEQKVMPQLALDDPGAYAKILSYRRCLIPPGVYLNQYTGNLLSHFLVGERKAFNRDHNHWFVICESGQLESSDARVSIPLDRLTIADTFPIND
ncbi:hypothetical protein B4P00_21980 [Shewanella xiamenensis]|uniref:hypothetical protein n=1 Tax=Shewanella xiamenensis TaxID=332186 RepID=UPI000849BFF3|nr:hypothetical protein [Shewanella xiamenensis]MBW0298839.1 hypothetical protein [Shewanella xiamenensis]ODR83780.1 hypothetical protein ABT47_23775 [Shewanella xiamenensis]